MQHADRLMRARPPMCRVAVGRYYYGMYHAMRAVVYFHVTGDDHEQHSVLPRSMPADFPDADFWKNALKDARLRRNEADYDPYPMSDVSFGRPHYSCNIWRTVSPRRREPTFT